LGGGYGNQKKIGEKKVQNGTKRTPGIGRQDTRISGAGSFREPSKNPLKQNQRRSNRVCILQKTTLKQQDHRVARFGDTKKKQGKDA